MMIPIFVFEVISIAPVVIAGDVEPSSGAWQGFPIDAAGPATCRRLRQQLPCLDLAVERGGVHAKLRCCPLAVKAVFAKRRKNGLAFGVLADFRSRRERRGRGG